MKFSKTQIFAVFSAILLLNGCANKQKNTTQAVIKPIPIKNAIIASEKVPSLLGTKWKYIDDDWEYELEFADKGVLKNTHPPFIKPVGKHRWRQKGTEVHFYFNGKTSYYKGKLSGRNLITGRATSKTYQGSWQWKAIRLEP